MKKIAYIFFGQVKNYNTRQHQAFLDNACHSLSDFKLDYYLVTTNTQSFNSPRQRGLEGINTSIDPLSIQNYFQFSNILLDGLEHPSSQTNQEIKDHAKLLVDNFGGSWGKFSLSSTINSLKQLYSLEYFSKNFSPQEQYDFYVLSRSDIFHTHYLNINPIIRCEKNKNEIFAPSFGWWKSGCNDRYAIFNSISALKDYCSRYSSIMNNPQWYHAESYLLSHLSSLNYRVKRIPNFRFRLIRANGLITNESGYKIDYNLTNSK
jgi:hypothetical protein